MVAMRERKVSEATCGRGQGFDELVNHTTALRPDRARDTVGHQQGLRFEGRSLLFGMIPGLSTRQALAGV